MKRIALTTILGLTLLSSCQNNKAPDAQALLGIAQQAHPTVPYCTEINPYGPYIIGHTLQVSHNDRKVDPRFAQLEGTKLITISPPPAGYDPNSLDDYTEMVTPSETMLSIAKDVMQPGGKTICRGDLKLTEVTEVTKPQNGVIEARGHYTYTPKAWNTPEIEELFHFPGKPETERPLTFRQMQDNSWKLDENQ